MSFLDPEVVAVLPGYIVLGAFVGFSAGMLGIGGGLILVPGLYYLLKNFGGEAINDEALMHSALATSMAIIFPTGLSSSWAQIKRKAVDWGAIKLMTPGLVVGVSCGIALVSGLKSETLKLIFGFGLYGITALMIFRKESAQATPILKKIYVAMPASLLFGVLATMLGIGGAVLNVPYLNRAGLPLKKAIATGSALGVIVSVPATIGYIILGNMAQGQGALGYINIMAVAMIVPASVMMAPWGVKVSHALPVEKLKLIFAALLMVVATKMLFEVL